MAKKHMRAAVDEVPQGNTSIGISEMDSNTPSNTVKELHGKEPIDKKNGRGASKLKLATDQQRPIEVDRNEFGQPVGKKSVDLSTFLGCLTREFVPYIVETWDGVSEDVKNKLWSCVRMKFKFKEWEKKSVLQKLNKLWRDGRSRVQISIREANVGPLASRKLALLKPEMMSKDEWDIFVERTLSLEFQVRISFETDNEKSKKFREMRQMQKHPHTMSRNGYARLAEEMKEIEECTPDLQNTTDIRDDALSRVLGPEPRGRVRGMGFGVKPSQVGAQIQQNASVKQLQNTVQQIQQTLAMLIEMNQCKIPEQAASGGVMSGIGNDFNNGHDANVANQNNGGRDKVNEFTATPESNQRIENPENIPENASCKLLHYNGDGAVVAEGRIASTDPKAKIHHITLGRSCWKVWVDRVIVKNVDLIRPNEEMSTLDDALASTVAWWPKLIVLDD